MGETVLSLAAEDATNGATNGRPWAVVTSAAEGVTAIPKYGATNGGQS